MQVNNVHEKVEPFARIGQGDGVFISTYGCQMNVNDSERMMSLLEMMNFRPVYSPEEASLILINSCSIREKPVHKVRSEVGKYRDLKRKNPQLKVGVTGCVAQQEKEKLHKSIPNLDFILGTDAIDQLPEVISRVRGGAIVTAARFEHSEPYHIETLVRNPGVSTFVNITKGCDNFCTFCVVPFTRGRERSRPMSHVLSDVEALVKRGVREVTLLGQNVNSYESECGADFGQLMSEIAVHTGIERIRFTTSHPKDFNADLIDIMHRHRNKIMDYVHLPAQSGNSEILERMNRGYTREEYISKAHMILDRFPGSVLSTDIIVGFPGETEEQFQDTMSLLDAVPYESIYAFAYSPRPFTKAAKFGDQVEESVKLRRLNELLAKHKEVAFALVKKYEGQVLQVLVEEYHEDNNRLVGRSTQNKMVHFTLPVGHPKELIGRTVPVLIREAFPLTLRGEVQ